MEWISINKKLPKIPLNRKFVRVLVADEGGFVREGFYDDEEMFWAYSIDQRSGIFNNKPKLFQLIPTHWPKSRIYQDKKNPLHKAEDFFCIN